MELSLDTLDDPRGERTEVVKASVFASSQHPFAPHRLPTSNELKTRYLSRLKLNRWVISARGQSF